MLLAVEVYVLLVVMRAVIVVFPLKRISARLGAPMAETVPADLTQQQAARARQIRWAVRAVSPYTPTESNCYPQALTARFLLGRRRIPSTVYYGARFAAATRMETHVWVRTGRIYVTGGPTRHRYTVVSSFADGPLIQPLTFSTTPRASKGATDPREADRHGKI